MEMQILEILKLEPITDEKADIQKNYLIDEEDHVGKGADVSSCFMTYLADVPAETLIIFADNCVGQNKNNSMMQPLSWLTLTKELPAHRTNEIWAESPFRDLKNRADLKDNGMDVNMSSPVFEDRSMK